MGPGLTHDLWRTRKSASHSTESIIEDVSVTNLHRNVTSHSGLLARSNFRIARDPVSVLRWQHLIWSTRFLIATIQSDFP